MKKQPFYAKHSFYLQASYSLAMLFGAAALAHAGSSVTTIASDIPMAENALVVNKNRLLVSSSKGVYELTKTQNNTWQKRLLPMSLANGSRFSNCQAGGIVKIANHAYTVCGKGFLFSFMPKHLFRIDLSKSSPSMKAVGRIYASGPNGLTKDAANNLYIADSGGVFSGGSLVKVVLNDQGIASQTTLKHFPFIRTNGAKFQGNRLYLSFEPFTFLLGRSYIRSYQVTPWGVTDEKTLTTSWRLIDDFCFNEKGILFSEYFANKVVQINPQGKRLASVSLTNPSSVHKLPPYTSDYHTQQYVVTQHRVNRVSMITLPNKD